MGIGYALVFALPHSKMVTMFISRINEIQKFKRLLFQLTVNSFSSFLFIYCSYARWLNRLLLEGKVHSSWERLVTPLLNDPPALLTNHKVGIKNAIFPLFISRRRVVVFSAIAFLARQPSLLSLVILEEFFVSHVLAPGVSMIL